MRVGDSLPVWRSMLLVAEFERRRAAGHAAFAFAGRMVDLPVVEEARALLARHEAIAVARRCGSSAAHAG